MEKSIAVLGLGKYGRSVASHLYDMGADVLAVDKNEDLVSDIAGKCTASVRANLADEDEVLALGLQNMDVVIVAMGGNLSASIISVSVAKEQGVPIVVAKSSSGRMSSVLRKVGADKIIDPEGEGGERSARILGSLSFKDFFRVDDNMYMIQINPKEEWIGKSLMELNLRKSKSLIVVAEKEKQGFWHFADPMKPIREEMVLLIAMEKKDMEKWGDL